MVPNHQPLNFIGSCPSKVKVEVFPTRLPPTHFPRNQGVGPEHAKIQQFDHLTGFFCGVALVAKILGTGDSWGLTEIHGD